LGLAVTTKVVSLPKKRLRSRVGQPRVKKSLIGTLKRAAAWRPLYELATGLHHWEPGDNGRPPAFPPEAVLLFGIAAQALGSLSKAEELFEDHATWISIRRELAARCPPSPGLQSGHASMNRGQFARYRDRYGIEDQALADLGKSFRHEMSRVAVSMGMFQKGHGSVPFPDASNAIFGDGTVLRAITTYSPNDRHVHPDTGEITGRRHDPDAGYYQTGDGEKVYGTKFGFSAGRLPHPNGTVILDIFSVTKGHDEAAQAVSSVRSLSEQLDAQAVVWDGALRGTHIDEIYELGLMTVNRVHGSGDGKIRSRNLGPHTFTSPHGAVEWELWAINAAPGIEVIAAGKTHTVNLERANTRKVLNRPRTRYRWYGDYRVPDTPPVPHALRGAEISLRLNTTRHDKARGLARADVLRAIAPVDPHWPQIHKLRPVSESINRMIKRRHPNGRAPAIGIPRQLFHLLCAALFHNLEAVFAHEQRTDMALAPTGTTGTREADRLRSTIAAGPSPPTITLRALP
jgi:hypothetical protein